jgi:hypothetical protein
MIVVLEHVISARLNGPKQDPFNSPRKPLNKPPDIVKSHAPIRAIGA